MARDAIDDKGVSERSGAKSCEKKGGDKVAESVFAREITKPDGGEIGGKGGKGGSRLSLEVERIRVTSRLVLRRTRTRARMQVAWVVVVVIWPLGYCHEPVA